MHPVRPVAYVPMRALANVSVLPHAWWYGMLCTIVRYAPMRLCAAYGMSGTDARCLWYQGIDSAEAMLEKSLENGWIEVGLAMCQRVLVAMGLLVACTRFQYWCVRVWPTRTVLALSVLVWCVGVCA